MARKRRKKRRPESFQPPPTKGGSGAGDGSGVPTRTASRQTGSRRRGARSEPPPAPWGSFPLSELVVFVALVFLVAGFFVSPPRGTVMVGAGLALGSLAGLEVSIREHFAGYRSHTLLLSGAVGVVVIAVLFVTRPSGLPPIVMVGAGAVAFGLAAWGLANVFKRRAGALFRMR